MINFIVKFNYIDLFNLCIGLKNDSKNLFYQNNFINRMRNAILKSPVFETQFGLKNYKEIIIPCIKDYDSFTTIDKKKYMKNFIN